MLKKTRLRERLATADLWLSVLRSHQEDRLDVIDLEASTARQLLRARYTI